jgi:hypothetical protein
MQIASICYPRRPSTKNTIEQRPCPHAAPQLHWSCDRSSRHCQSWKTRQKQRALTPKRTYITYHELIPRCVGTWTNTYRPTQSQAHVQHCGVSLPLTGTLSRGPVWFDRNDLTPQEPSISKKTTTDRTERKHTISENNVITSGTGPS